MVSREMISFLNRRNDVRNRVLAEMVKEPAITPGHLNRASLDIRGNSVLIAKRLVHIQDLEHLTSILLERKSSFDSSMATVLLNCSLRTTQAILLLLYQTKVLDRKNYGSHGYHYFYWPRKS